MITAVPSSPDPDIVTLVGSLIRHLLTVLATLGVVHGVASDSAVTLVASALVGIAMTGWSIAQKVQAKQRDHAGNVLSAQAGRPMQPAA